MDNLETALVALGIDPAFAADGFRSAHPFVVAIEYARDGKRVMPSGNKWPWLREWQHRASCDPRFLVKQQMQKSPPCWSILLGRANGLWGIDVDGVEGRRTLQELERQHGPLPPTVRCNSPRIGGGFHLYFLPPPDCDFELRTGSKHAGPGLDTRGHGGQLVIAGSLHKSGNRYAFAPGHAPDEIAYAVMPEAWLQILPEKIIGEDSAPKPSRSRGSSGPRRSHDHDAGSWRIGDGEGYGGFNRPIFKRICQFWACDDADDSKVAEFMAVLQQTIMNAPRAEGRDDEQVERYASAAYLGNEFARAKFFVRK